MSTISAALPFVALAVSLASFVWSVRLWCRQVEIEAEAAARDRLIAAGLPSTPDAALEAFCASRPLLDEKGAA